MSDVSAFKQLFSNMVINGGEGSIPKKAIKCYVKESFPHFLVTDGYFYVACYFTKKAVDEFHSKFSNLNISTCQDDLDLCAAVGLFAKWWVIIIEVNLYIYTYYGWLYALPSKNFSVHLLHVYLWIMYYSIKQWKFA